MSLTFKEFVTERCWPGYKPAPGKPAYSKGSCVKEETLDEMDKSAPQPGRDGKVSHSTYGSRDKEGSDYFKGKELPAKPITVKKMEKDALDILKKQGVVEGKKPDRYHIVGKNGKPANLGSYADKDSAIKDRDEKYPGAVVQQVGPRGKVKGVAEAVKDKYDEGEYDREGDMAKSDLRSIIANAKRVHDMLDDADNLPEGVQSKITLAEDYISTVANYMTSEMTEETIKEGMFSKKNPPPMHMIIRGYYDNMKQGYSEDDIIHHYNNAYGLKLKPGDIEKHIAKNLHGEDWQKVNRQDKTDGLSPAAVKAYRRENPGSKLQTAVTEKNPKGKRAKRRLSFCRRMKGMKARLTSAENSRDPDSPINKALRRWNC